MTETTATYSLELVKRVADHLEKTVEEVVARWREEAAKGDEVAAAAVAQYEALE